jgi:microcin C transport system permease protein
VLYGLSLCAELIANDKPILVQYRGEFYTPVLKFYPETAFGGDLPDRGELSAPEVQCLIVAGGSRGVLGRPRGVMAEARAAPARRASRSAGWIIWPLIPYSYNTIVDTGGCALRRPTRRTGWAPTTPARDVLARVIYGFRLSVTFALIVTAPDLGHRHRAGAVQGYFGG